MLGVVEVEEAQFVATWAWVTNEKDCGICRRSFESCCPTCVVPGDDCPISVGMCKHTFHLHCIETALQKSDSCPLCSAKWES